MRLRSNAYALLPLAALVLSGCATPRQCLAPEPPPAELMIPAPKEGSFRRRLDEISAPSSMPRPNEPTR